MKVSIDSRTIAAGEIFIPIKGHHHDGHAFIPDVIRKGAKVLDVDLTQFAKKYRKKLATKIIAITGSAGKTTTKDLLASVLSQKFTVHKTQENENNEIGVPLTLLKTDFDDEIAIIELGMRGPNQIKPLASILRPTHTIITNIGLAHVELLGSQKNIALAKAELFQKPLIWESQPRFAFLNFSTPYYDLLYKKAQKAGYTVLPFSGTNPFDQSLNLVQTVGRHFGLSNEDIQAGIQTFESSSHRLKTIKTGTLTLIDDTYNANPDGVNYALEVLRRIPGRKLVILGDMLELGNFSQEAHQAVANNMINAEVELFITLGPLGKTIRKPSVTHIGFTNREELHRFLKAEVRPGDVILIKGSRSMKMEETVAALEQFNL